MEIDNNFHDPEGEQDASQNSTQPGAEIQVLRLCRREAADRTEPAYSLGQARFAAQQPAGVLPLRTIGPCYDTLKPRRFEFVPLWGIPVFFEYAMRRVDCPRCGVSVEYAGIILVSRDAPLPPCVEKQVGVTTMGFHLRPAEHGRPLLDDVVLPEI